MTIATKGSVRIKLNQQSLPHTIIFTQGIESHNLLSELTQLSSSSPASAVSIDLTGITGLESPAWFREIRATLKQYNMILIGVYNPQLNLEICKALKIPVLDDIRSQNASPTGQTVTQRTEKPVRTGQQLYAKHGSLVITQSLSSGAEVAARDDVHVYGSANGKIIAGATGNTSARIYIQRGYPELVSIAGVTWLSDKITATESPQQFY